MRLAFASYLDAISEEAARVGDALVRPGQAGSAAGDRRASEIVEHLVASLTGAAGALGAPSHGTAASGDVEEAAAHLVAALQAAGPDAVVDHEALGPGAAGPSAAALARRIALECALGRCDLERERGQGHPVETELAVDGIGERLEGLAAMSVLPITSLGGSLSLVCSDDPTAFLVEVVRSRLSYRERRGPADAVVVGTASALFSYAWGRVARAELRLSGSAAVADAFCDLPGESA